MSAPYTWIRDVLEFNQKAESPIQQCPTTPEDSVKRARIKLIQEEVIEETIPALERGDLRAIADGLADSIYVLIGTALAYGIDLEPIWNEVHRTNLSKVNDTVTKDQNGKIVKPSDWTPPQIEEILKRQESLESIYPEIHASRTSTNYMPCSVKLCLYRGEVFLPHRLNQFGFEYRAFCRQCAVKINKAEEQRRNRGATNG